MIKVMAIEQLYEQYIKSMSYDDQLRLVAMITQHLAKQPVQPEPVEKTEKRSLLELEGLGAEIWEGIDAQQYIRELRKEWNHRP